jgi:hypothetical protein
MAMSEDPHGHCGGYYQAGHACGEVDDLIDRAESAEATLAKIRDYADNAGFPDDTEVRYAMGANDVLNDLRRILDGEQP